MVSALLGSVAAGGARLAVGIDRELQQDLADGVVEAMQGTDEVPLGDWERSADAVDGVGEADLRCAMGGDPCLGQGDEVRAAVRRVLMVSVPARCTAL